MPVIPAHLAQLAAVGIAFLCGAAITAIGRDVLRQRARQALREVVAMWDARDRGVLKPGEQALTEALVRRVSAEAEQ